nr:hypothetical protein [Paraburkholderia sp. HP33-1]
MQASTGLVYEIFRQHDRGSLLFGQADTEVLLREIDVLRIRIVLERMNASRVAAFVGCRVCARAVLSLWDRSWGAAGVWKFHGAARETGRAAGEQVFLAVQQRVIELRS